MRNKNKFYLALVIFSLTGQIAWVVENMYLNVFIYKMFGASASQISLMVSLSAASATVTTILIGALADKLGKRRTFISGGYILWGISILGFALIRKDVLGAFAVSATSVSAVAVTLVITLDCLMTFFGSTANDACFNAWLTDMTTEQNRGRAEGINSMMPLVAILAVFGGFMGFDLGKASSWTAIFVIIGAAVILIGIVGFFVIDEPKLDTKENGVYFKNLAYGFTPSVIRENYRLYLLLGAFALFGISIQIFMPYLILYYTVSLQMTDYVFIMAPAIILAALFTVFFGRLYDKLKFRASVLPTLALLCLGYVLLFIFKVKALVFAGSLLMMCGYLAGSAVFGAAIRDLTPENRAGAFQGLRILAQVLIPGVIGPAIGAAVLKNAETVVGDDGTVSFVPNESIFLAALIAAVILAFALTVAFVLAKKSKKENA
jgi:MFS family permease